MREATVTIEGVAPLSMSRPLESRREQNEPHDAFEERTWRERCNADGEGKLQIPPMAFKRLLNATAKFMGETIPGQGKKTYTKRFVSGVLAFEPMLIAPSIHRDNVEGEWLFVPSSGIAGDGKRVMKRFPVVRKWSGTVTLHVIDDMIKNQVFEEYLSAGGKFIGLGRFRPEKNGFYGRFAVSEVRWS